MVTAKKSGLTTTQIAQTGLMVALALVLSYLETLVPLPVTIPGFKLGLANVAILFTLYAVDTRMAFVVAVIKVVVSGLLFGSPVMALYSLAGTTLAFCGMYLLWRSDKVGIIVVSVVSAILHNVGQLFVAALMLQTALIWVNLPVLAVAAVITGCVTGAVAAAVLKAVHVRNLPPAAREREGE